MRLKTTEEFITDIENRHPGKYTILGEYTGLQKRILTKYNKCGHIYSSVADKIQKGRNCPVCYGGIKLTQEEFETRVAEINPHLEVIGIYAGMASKIKVRCKLCNQISYPLADAVARVKMTGCAVCMGKIVVRGYNDLWTTASEVAELLVNSERGYELTKFSEKKEDFRCPICNHILRRFIGSVSEVGLKCSYCSQRVSYPEKFFKDMLNQLCVDYETQKVFNWSMCVTSNNKQLNGKKIYDFYIPSKQCVIETHGSQHYEENKRARGSLQLEQENDKLKEQIAIKNGIKYISIDCRKSNIEWIKKHILNSDFGCLFDISNIDWKHCNEYAVSSNVNEAVELWNYKYTVIEIAEIMKLSSATIRTYLHTGEELGLCIYSRKKKKELKTNQN